MYDPKKRFDKYHILEQNEVSNYSIVYRAKSDDGKVVALKCAKRAQNPDNELINREFQVLSRIRHPNIVQVIDFDVTEDDASFLVMEYIPGQALNKVFNQFTDDLVAALIQVLAGVAAFHDRGLVHTDLKPEHIIYDPALKKPVIIDFGFAGFSKQNDLPAGTLGYIAPEVIKGLTPDQRSDLFSLGIIIYEILAGRKPTGPDDSAPDIPDEINRLLQRLLAEEPALRPSLPEIHRAFCRHLGRDPDRPLDYRVDLPQPVFLDPSGMVDRMRAAKNPVSIVLGGAGSGKTRILKELRFRCQQAGIRVFSHRSKESIGLCESLAEFCGFAIGPRRDRFSAFEGLNQILIRAAEDRRTVLMIDDADELGDHDLDLINYLSIGLAFSGVNVICGARDQRRIPARDPLVFPLSPFSPAEVRELIDRTFAPITVRTAGAKIPIDDFADWLHEQTGGNPLGVTETMKYLQIQGVLEYGPAGWQVFWDHIHRISIPSRIEDILAGQLGQLTDDQRQLLDIMAVIDFPVEPCLLAGINGQPIDISLENLKRSGLIREEFEGRRRTLFPASRFIRVQIESRLTAADRRRIYSRIADTFDRSDGEADRYLLLRGRMCRELGRDPEALEYLTRAGEQAEKNHDHRSALDAFDQAVQLSRKTDPGKYHRLLLRTAGLLKSLGFTEQARAAYRETVETGPEEIRITALTDYGRFLCSIGEPGPGAEFLQRSRTLMAENDAGYARTLNSLGYAQMMTGRMDSSNDLFQAALTRARINGDRAEESTALYNQSIHAWYANDLERAISIAREGLEFCRANGLDFDLAYFANLLTTGNISRNDLKAAREYNDLAIEVFTRTGHVQLLNHALQNKSTILYDEGDLSGSEKILQKTLERAAQMRNREDLYYAYLNIGIIREFTGQFSDALEYYRQAAEAKPEKDAPAYRAAVVRFKTGDLKAAEGEFLKLNRARIDPENHISLALIHNQLGDRVKAQEELEQADRLLKKDPASQKFAHFLESAGRIHLEAGDFDRALDCAERLEAERRDDRYSGNLAEAYKKLARFGAGSDPALDLSAEENAFSEMGYLYELGLMKKLALDALYRRDRSAHWPEIINVLGAGEEIFYRLGCRAELDSLKKQRTLIYSDLSADLTRRTFDDSYLDTFSQLADLISRELGTEEFPDRVLDLIISATRAERGALFLMRSRSMELIAGRGLDQTTKRDAESFSRTVLDKLERAEIVFVPNALTNPDYNLKKSVILNQIRSILCIPLAVGGSILGAVYLDSRIPDRNFDPRDREFLLAVSRILASVIEKSLIFSATQKENVLLRANIIQDIGRGYMVGKSRAMKLVYKKIEDTAPTDLPILIHGETGTGKGMIARLIHLKSRRRDKRFLTINCGTIPETILESELFGHKKGSFTGAVSDKRGLLEEAEAGTIFLDEITNTSLAFQAKLLEAIEEKTIRRVGETVTRKIDVRFLFATNQDLEIEVEEGRFRKDLFYRINVFEIEIPPLRDRRNDIPQLAQLFLERFRQEINKKIDGFTDETLERLRNNHWPGNVRELQNVIERSVIQARNRMITPEDIGTRDQRENEDQTIRSIKKEAIIDELKATNGNVQAAAKNLGVNRRTIQRYIKMYKINK